MTDSSDDAAALRERMRADPQGVLAEQFSRLKERLAGIVRFRNDPQLAKRVDVEDILQETWLAASKRVDHFLENEDYSLFVWLRLLLGQTLIDLQRHHLGTKMRDAGREKSIQSAAFPASASVSIAAQLLGSLTSPSQAAVRDEMAKRIESAIDGMDPIDRDVLMMRHFEELTNSEIAEVLGIEQKAASIRYVRAIRRLKETLRTTPGFDSEA